MQVPIFERIAKILQTNEITFYVTRSALVELDSLPKDDTIFSDARQFGLDECEIIERTDYMNRDNNNNNDSDRKDDEVTPSQDIENLVKNGNKDGYFVATQDKKLSDNLRNMIYVPQMWLTKSVLIFDTPSAVSRKASQREEREKQRTGGGTMTSEESELIQRLRSDRIEKNKNKNAIKDGGNERRKRKAKGPNPLSCKKKKEEEGKSAGTAKKRKRRRKVSRISE